MRSSLSQLGGAASRRLEDRHEISRKETAARISAAVVRPVAQSRGGRVAEWTMDLVDLEDQVDMDRGHIILSSFVPAQPYRPCPLGPLSPLSPRSTRPLSTLAPAEIFLLTPVVQIC